MVRNRRKVHAAPDLASDKRAESSGLPSMTCHVVIRARSLT